LPDVFSPPLSHSPGTPADPPRGAAARGGGDARRAPRRAGFRARILLDNGHSRPENAVNGRAEGGPDGRTTEGPGSRLTTGRAAANRMRPPGPFLPPAPAGTP